MRDPERQHRYNNSFKISYPDFPSISNEARSIVLHQEMGKHDILEIHYPKFSTKLVKTLKTGVPVKVTWKNDKVSGEFFGYTTDVSYPVAQQLSRGLKVTCVAASYPLKEQSSKIWTNKTASEIAVEIAKKYKLKPVVTYSPIRFTQQSLAGHSYWEKLNEIAAKIGYGVQVVKTELHFHPIDKMIDQFMTTIPVMSFQNPLENPVSSLVAPTLEHFEPRVGDYVETVQKLRTTNTVSGVDPITSKIYSSQTSSNKVGKNLRENTTDPLFSSIETKIVTASSAMADSLSKARAQWGRLGVPSKGIGQGDPRIAPWRTVEVRGTGETTDGFWIVQKAEHVIHGDGRYAVEFSCLSDGIGNNKSSAFRPSSAGTVPTRNLVNELSTPNTSSPTSTTLSAATAMVTEQSSGYKVTPRRWKGR